MNALFNFNEVKAGRWEIFIAKLFGKKYVSVADNYTWTFYFFRNKTYVSCVKNEVYFPW